jgi:hypothetical protein
MEVEDRNSKTSDQTRKHNGDDPILNANTADPLETERQSPGHPQEQIVPVLEEDYSISKQTSVKEAKIEKRVLKQRPSKYRLATRSYISTAKS